MCEPLGGGLDRRRAPAEGRRGFRGTPENCKTKICLRWENGNCHFGPNCAFAHGEAELRRPPGRGDGPPHGRQGLFRLPGQPQQAGQLPILGPGLSLPQKPSPAGLDLHHLLDLQRSVGSAQGLATPGLPPFQGALQSSQVGAHFAAQQESMLGLLQQQQQQQQRSRLPAPAGLLNPGLDALHNDAVWVAQGRPIPGPNGWTAYHTPDTGEVYYHHAPTNYTTWEQPPDWGR